MTDSELRGVSSAERTLDARELASWRPAIPKAAPRSRKPSVLREVTNGIVCFCGERFGESQALEFMLHLRAEVGEDLDRVDRRRRRDRERQGERYASDPDYRDQKNAYRRSWVAAHPEFRERDNQRKRERRQAMTPEQRKHDNERRAANRRKQHAYDPEAAERLREYHRRYRAEHPEFRERQQALQRERRARKAAELRAGKTCALCGKPFTPQRKNGMYCSNSCRSKAGYRRTQGASSDAVADGA